MASSRKTPTLCERDTRQLWGTNLIQPLARESHEIYNPMINRVGKLCVAAMRLWMIVLIVTRKRGDGRYYFALRQTNNNTPNKLLLSESAVSCLLRVRSVFLIAVWCPFHIKSAWDRQVLEEWNHLFFFTYEFRNVPFNIQFYITIILLDFP
jgi:hypothetical protein